MTKDIMEALGIRNWSTATSMLRKLEVAGLVSMEDAKVGRYRSVEKLWRIEPQFGAKVAAALEEAERGIEAAARGRYPSAGRPGIIDVESSGERLVIMVENAVKSAIGNA
jgi:hypothetical protein